jgi:hypothetical protein
MVHMVVTPTYFPRSAPRRRSAKRSQIGRAEGEHAASRRLVVIGRLFNPRCASAGARGNPRAGVVSARAVSDWKRYPYVPDWGDPKWFTFPDVDGLHPELGMATYFVDGFLRGRTSGREYAFMTIVTDMRVLGKRFRASFYTFALYDRRAPALRHVHRLRLPAAAAHPRGHKVDHARGHLTLRYAADAGGMSWLNKRDDAGALVPFAWTLDLRGRDHHGASMALTLDVDAERPPAPLGGRMLGGKMMFLGLPETFSYFQSGLRMRGELAWGDVKEAVEGEVGWIDRQWAVEDFTRHQDRKSARYRNEWRVMQFGNGWDLSVFHQYLRPKRNAIVPWTGLSAQGPAPAFELRATPHVELELLEFIKSPGIVRGRELLTDGPRYFPVPLSPARARARHGRVVGAVGRRARAPASDRVLDRARRRSRGTLFDSP